MLKNWYRKNQKAINIAFIIVLAAALITLFVFALFNLPAIKTFTSGLFATLLPFVYGFVFAFLCNPIYKKLHRYVFRFCDYKKPRPKLRKGLSIFFAFILLLGMIALLLYAVISQLIQLLDQETINLYINEFTAFGNDIVNAISGTFQLDAKEIVNFVVNEFSEIANNLIKNDLGTFVTNFAKEIISQLFAIVVGLILAIYFLIYKESFTARIKRFLCATFKKDTYEKIINFGRYTHKTFNRYIVGAIIDSILVGFVVFVILEIIQFPFAPLIGVVVGVTNVIPFFGPFIGAIPSAILILLGSLAENIDGKDSIIRVIIFAVIILIVQQIDGNIIAPHIQGTATGLTPVGVIFAVTLCSDLFGFIGMLIGVPVFAVISYLFSSLLEKRLRKKKLPINVSCYQARDIYTDEGFLKAKNAMEAQERASRHEAVEKAKAEQKITEEEIQAVENRIVDEIISTAVEETTAKAEADKNDETGLITPIKSDFSATGEHPKANKKDK